MTGAPGEGYPRPGEAVPSGDRWRGRFLLRFALLVAASSLLLLLGFRAVLRLPLDGGYGEVYRSLRVLEARLPLLVALLFSAWTLFLGGAAALLCVLSLRRVAGPLCRMERLADDLAAAGPGRPVRFRADDAGGDLAEAYEGFADAVRRDRDACLSLLVEARRAAAGDGGREAARNALREVATVLSRYW